MIIEQMSWDFGADVEPEPLYYESSLVATHCRDCRRPVKGRHTSCQGGANSHGHYVICDPCGIAGQDARRAAQPFLDCGKHKTPYDDAAHAEECYGLVCPFCGLSEGTGQQVIQAHNWVFWNAMNYGMCLTQRYAWERVSSCIKCRCFSWGKTDEPCPNCARLKEGKR